MKTRWFSGKFGTTITANANNKEKITDLSLESSGIISGNKWWFGSAYDVLKKVGTFSTSYKVDALTSEATYNTADGEIVLKGSQQINDRNSFSSSVALKSRKMTYDWTRKWQGGSLSSTFLPSDKKLNLVWRDDGATGTWTTQATLPLDDMSNTKISFSHNWVY